MVERIFALTAFPVLAALLAAACMCAPAHAWAADDVALQEASATASPQAQRPAQANTANAAVLTVERSDGALLLSAQLGFLLPAAVRDALVKGVPVYFIAEADIRHPRWYWTDKELGHVRRYWRMSYLPLTRRWQLASSSEPLSEVGIGTGLARHYDSLDSAVAALQRITGWRVADEAALEDGGQQILTFSFRIDTAQLPRALQIGMAGQADWRLHLQRSLDLAQMPVSAPPPSAPQPQPQDAAP